MNAKSENQLIPAFVVNLERRKDRLDFMREQLDPLGINWTRINALDARVVDDRQLDKYSTPSGHVIAMERGSRAAAATVLALFQSIYDQGIQAALIMEDDVVVAPDLPRLLASPDWIPDDIGLIQLEKHGRKGSRRLAGPPRPSPAEGRHLHKLKSRTGGAACYIITRRAIGRILEDFSPIKVPLDHYLFSPNLGPVFDDLGVAIVAPALARQADEQLNSDIGTERAQATKSFKMSVQRGWSDINRLPRQIFGLVKGDRMIPFEFQSDVGANT